MQKTLALAIDFKTFTPSILKTGLFLIKNVYLEKKIILFHVIEYFLTPPHYILPYFREEKKKLEAQLLEISQEFQKENILPDIHVLLGNFWNVLSEFIETVKPHLIIMGYQPHKVKISTGEKMIERLKSNFLIVKQKPVEKIENILCCIDFSETSLECLKMANFLSERLNSKVKVLNVIPQIQIKDKLLEKEALEEERLEREKKWQNLLKSLNEKKSLKNLEFFIKYGEKNKEITKIIRTDHPDILIIGKRGKVIKTGLGSFTKEILKTLEIPLLIVEEF